MRKVPNQICAIIKHRHIGVEMNYNDDPPTHANINLFLLF